MKDALLPAFLVVSALCMYWATKARRLEDEAVERAALPTQAVHPPAENGVLSPYYLNTNAGGVRTSIPVGLKAELSDGRKFVFNGTEWKRQQAEAFIENYKQYEYDMRRKWEKDDYEQKRGRKMQDMKAPSDPNMTLFGAWAKETNCEIQGLLLWPATNLTFAFTHKPMPSVFSNGVYIIRFEP